MTQSLTKGELGGFSLKLNVETHIYRLTENSLSVIASDSFDKLRINSGSVAISLITMTSFRLLRRFAPRNDILGHPVYVC